MKSQMLKTSNHGAFRLHYHIILSIKYRKPVITAEILERLESIFRNVLKQWRCELVEFGGETDHVHLLVDAHPSLNLARMIGNLKTVSARRIRKEFAKYLQQFFWKPYFWNKAYAVISVGGRAPLEKLLQYIQDQEKPKPSGLTSD